jgi:hypothetical protein
LDRPANRWTEQTMPTGAAAVNLAIAEFKYADNAYGQLQ